MLDPLTGAVLVETHADLQQQLLDRCGSPRAAVCACMRRSTKLRTTRLVPLSADSVTLLGGCIRGERMEHWRLLSDQMGLSWRRVITPSVHWGTMPDREGRRDRRKAILWKGGSVAARKGRRKEVFQGR